jgi:hypothetical protein
MAKRKRKSTDKPGKKSKVKPPQPELSPLFDLPSPKEFLTEEQKEDLTPREKRWFEFKEAGYEEQIALCHQTIEEPELMDEENAFEMFNTIYYSTVEHDERHRFEKLASKLRERLPDIFAAEAHYILDWQITNALAESRQKNILPLALELAQTGGQHLDMFVQTLDMLDYHGQLPVLFKMMPVAWPDIKHSTGYFEWAINEFAACAADYTVFGYLELKPDLEADNPDLQEKLSFYLADMNQDALTKFINQLTGRTERTWVMSDFGFERQQPQGQKTKKPTKTANLSEQAKQNLYDLTIEFLRYLRQEENVPYLKGRLARRSIFEYLLERHAGELVPQESMFEAMMRGPGSRPRKPKQIYPAHWLCPDRNTFDHYLANLLHFMSGRYHQAVATFELIPAWLRFLESRQLIDADQRDQTLQELRGLDTEFLKLLKTHADPALARAIEQWRKKW